MCFPENLPFLFSCGRADVSRRKIRLREVGGLKEEFPAELVAGVADCSDPAEGVGIFLFLENGEEIVQETRRFDEKSGKTFSMRRKEDANDYRYFPDPDLAPIEMSEQQLSELEASIPVLPDARKAKYIEQFGLTPFDAEMLTATPETADYFESVCTATEYAKQAANLMLTEVFRLMSAESEDTVRIPVSPEHLAELVNMTVDGQINSSTEKKVLGELWKKGDQSPEEYVRTHDLLQLSDRATLEQLVDQAIAKNPKSIADFKKGKTNALKSLVGQVMGQTGGRANPVIVQQLIDEKAAKF